MEVDGVPSELEGLTNICQFSVGDTANRCFVAWRVKHDCGTVLVVLGCLWVSLVLDVSSQKTDFSLQVDVVIQSVGVVVGIMLIEKSRIKC